MEIKLNTKFNPGDEVWMMIENYPVKLEVFAIKISEQFLKCSAILTYTYTLYDMDGIGYYKIEEKDLCKTKEELKQKIFG